MWVIGVVAVVGVVLWDDHSDWGEHSAYSDAAERAARERKAREEERIRNFSLAKKEMNLTLDSVRDSLAREAGFHCREFTIWNKWADNLAFRNFNMDYNSLNEETQAKINQATKNVLNEQEAQYKAELEDINRILRDIENARLGRK